ncbi:energy transducer TonB [Lysobacter yangpyeongensis]|uniref:Energy transducer TonB n=1 Tax=Lysobacter yangpyeongensis TaxID=346182 RepID=A0ABW0SM99_9GAMM
MAFAHYEAHMPDEANTRPAASSHNLTLLLLLLLAAVLFGWYRYNQIRSGEAASPATSADTTLVTAPAPAATVAGSDAAVAHRSRSARSDTTARATPRSSAPSPIAGNPMPEYPAVALRHGEGGTVVLQVQVDARGQPIDVDVARRSGSRELDRAALQAVRDWRFKPATRNGKPVTSVIELPIDFKPQG